MSRRSKVRGGFMPDYASYCMDGMCSFKVYYDGVFCHGSKPEQTRYVGGSSDFFDFAKPSTMGMVDLWSFALQLGYPNPNNIRFWHKNGDSLHMGRYLESDADVCSIANHIPKDFIVELFIEESGFTSMKILPTQESQVESAIDEVQAEEEEEEEEEELPTDERGKEKQLAPMNLQLRDIPDDVDLGDEPNIPPIPSFDVSDLFLSDSDSDDVPIQATPTVVSGTRGQKKKAASPISGKSVQKKKAASPVSGKSVQQKKAPSVVSGKRGQKKKASSVVSGKRVQKNAGKQRGCTSGSGPSNLSAVDEPVDVPVEVPVEGDGISFHVPVEVGVIDETEGDGLNNDDDFADFDMGNDFTETDVLTEVGVSTERGTDQRGKRKQVGDPFDSDSCDDDYHDSEYEFEEDDELFETYVDPDVEFAGVGVKSGGKNDKSEHLSKGVYEKMSHEDGEDNCLESDSLDSGCSSDGHGGVKFPMFNPRTDSKNPELKIGMIFSSKAEAKFVIESHCFRRGMMVSFPKNDSIRLRVCCRNDGCPWTVHVSPMHNDHVWQIKTYVSDHKNCSWNYNNKSLKSNWLGKTFQKKFKENPKLGVSEFRNEVCKTLKASVSKSQAYKAKRKALQSIEGSEEEHFRQIRSYCQELKRTDPTATVILKLIEVTEGPRFQRMYVCFSACKEGFKTACRPVIGVDGCFLKSQRGGQLLTAVGLDPNNNIFPISYAVCEGETKDTWMWFLQLLDGDIGFQLQHNWTFMSDKQKGLIPAFEALFPNAENRFCVRHLHSNMKKDGFMGMAVKNALWAAARATRIEEFNRRMEELKAIDEAAYAWLVKKPPNQWSRSHFLGYPKCDILLNNMCECFNSFILEAREKPIIPMLESIRNLLMAKMVINREKAGKWDTNICPKIRATLIKNMTAAGECIPIRSDEWNFQINGMFDQHTVDVRTRTCSCRRWDLTGIPCKHAISAIWCRREEPEPYVHSCYSVESYKKAYAKSIAPITGQDLWPQCTLQPPLPPIYKEKAGRPKNLRRRQPDEPPAASSGTKLRGVPRINNCRRCGKPGHNARSCGKTVALSEGENVGNEAPSESTNAETESSPVVESNNAGNQAPVVVPEVPPITQTHGSTSGAGTNSSERVVIAPPNKKLPVRRPEKRNSNTTSAVNVQVSGGSAIKTPVIVKGGVNFITVSNLRASFGQGATAGSSRSTQSPNTASAGSSPNTAPISYEPTTRKKPFRAPRPSNDLK